IRLFPVETASVDQEDFFITEKIKGELLIVCDIELFHIDLREDIESSFWLNGTDAGNIGQCFVNIVSLFSYTSARLDIAAHALMAAQCCLDDRLCGNIGAEPHIGEHFKSFNVILRDLFVPA